MRDSVSWDGDPSWASTWPEACRSSTNPTTNATQPDMQEVVTILNNRVNGLGVSGATVNLQGKDVNVSVPGVTDARQVLAIVGQTAQLLFRPVLCEAEVGTNRRSSMLRRASYRPARPSTRRPPRTSRSTPQPKSRRTAFRRTPRSPISSRPSPPRTSPRTRCSCRCLVTRPCATSSVLRS